MDWFDLWSLAPLSTIFQIYCDDQFNCFTGGGHQSTWRKPKPCRKSLTNFITHSCIEYTSPRMGFELTTVVVIGTDWTGSYKSNYNTFMATTAPQLLLVTWRIIAGKSQIPRNWVFTTEWEHLYYFFHVPLTYNCTSVSILFNMWCYVTSYTGSIHILKHG